MKSRIRATLLVGGLLFPEIAMAQAMVPSTGMDDANKPMPTVERMQRRYPQPVRVGDLVGAYMLDNSTLDPRLYVRQVVHTAAGKIELIVAYNKWFGWFGWFTRPVAVPIRKSSASRDGNWHRSTCPTANTLRRPRAGIRMQRRLPNDATIQIALARNVNDHDFVKPITFRCFPTYTG